MPSTAMFFLGILLLLASGCATTATKPAPQRLPVRDATEGEKRLVAELLLPLLVTSGVWTRPADGCSAALGIQPANTINLSVGPNTQCRFSLVITEEALKTLPREELQAAMAHELGHVQLGHFEARKERRVAERERRKAITEKGTTAGAVATVIPVIGPLLAAGIAGSQSMAEASVQEEYRTYDRDEEQAADRFGLELLQQVIGRGSGCQAEVALLERLSRETSARAWSAWLSTHPRPSDRLKVVRELCPQ